MNMRCLGAFGALLCVPAVSLAVTAEDVAALNQRLLSAGKRSPAARGGTDLAQQRRAAMESLIKTNPQAALSVVLSTEQREGLRKSGYSRTFLEAPLSFTGPVDVTVLDDLKGRRSVLRYEFEVDGEKIVAYQNDIAAAGVECGATVRLDGYRVGETMAVRSSKVVERAAAGTGCSSTGPQRTAVMITSFAGAPGRQLTKSEINSMVFGDGKTVSTFYRDASYGKAELSGEVFGPYQLDRSYTCEETSLLRQAAFRAADADIDFKQFQRVVILFPGDDDCAWGGLGTIGCQQFSSTGETGFRSAVAFVDSRTENDWIRAVITHELGHNLGVNHAKSIAFPESTLAPFPDYANLEEYGDRFSIMGGEGNTLWDFGIGHKLELGWLSLNSDIRVVEQPGEFVLAPINRGSGIRGLKVRRRLSPDEWLWLEFREATTLMEGSTRALRNAFEGVLVRHTGAETLSTFLLDMTPATIDERRLDSTPGYFVDPVLRPGSIWRDKHSGLTIEVKGIEAEGIRVAVRYDTPCAVLPTRALEIGTGGATQPVTPLVSNPCEWQASSDTHWLRAGKTGSTVNVEADRHDGLLHRYGSITVDRQVATARQVGSPSPARVISAAPTSGAVATDELIAGEVTVEDLNGIQELGEIRFLVGTSATERGSCLVRYNVLTDTVSIAGADGVTFSPEPASKEWPRIVASTTCGFYWIGAFPISDTQFIAFYGLFLDPRIGAGPLKLYTSVTERTGQSSGYVEQSTLQLETGCSVTPEVSRFPIPAAAGELPVGVWTSQQTCVWQASSNVPWLRVASTNFTGDNPATVTFDANTGATERSGIITIGERKVTLVQAAPSVQLTPGRATVSAEAGRDEIGVTSDPDDLDWTATPNVSWLRVVDTTDEKLIYRFESNRTGAQRTGVITVGDQQFTVTQRANDPNRPLVIANGVVNGASFEPMIASGSWISIIGERLSSTTRSWHGGDFAGRNLPTSLDGVRVRINGKPAYVAYISPGQINALAPEDTTNGTVYVEVENNGNTAVVSAVLRSTTAPAMFMLPAPVADQVAAIAADGTLLTDPGVFAGANTRGAKPGEVVQLFATGLGTTAPGYPAGQVFDAPLPLATQPSVFIGGVRAAIAYAGLISPGVYQLNVVVPELGAGKHAVRIFTSDNSSPLRKMLVVAP